MNDKYLIYGTMGLGGDWNPEVPLTEKDFEQGEVVIKAVLDNGINFFDLADIYRAGKSEKVMGAFLNKYPDKRKEMIIQSKVAIRLDDKVVRYDFSYDYVMTAVEGVLERLNTDYLDILLLHRPDPLMDGKELSRAIKDLFDLGKIKDFGVSNMNHHQIQLLEDYTGRKVMVNQLEMSLHKSDFVKETIGVNNDLSIGSSFPSGTLEYCMRKDVSLQAWGSLAQGMYSGRGEENEASLYVASLAKRYNVSKEGIVLAWLMKHPANIKPVIGTTSIKRIKACTDALKIELSREEWYELFVRASKIEMP